MHQVSGLKRAIFALQGLLFISRTEKTDTSYPMGRTVYILDPRDTDTSGVFGRALTRRMESQYDLNIKTLTSDEGNVPLLLLCHSYSRIGTDIDTATSRLRGSDPSNVAVLVIHVREPHALPSTNPTENLYDAKYDAFGRLIDFAFSQSTGIYVCRMNTDADRKLKDFLKKFVDVTPRYNVGYDEGHEQGHAYPRDTGGICTWVTRDQRICLIIIAAVVVVVVIILLATLT